MPVVWLTPPRSAGAEWPARRHHHWLPDCRKPRTLEPRLGIEIPFTHRHGGEPVALATLIGLAEADDEEGARPEFPVQPSR